VALATAALALVVSGSAALAATPVGSSITEDTTWTLAGSPYVLAGDATVTEDTTLTIDPGVVVRSAPGARLFVAGTLKATGTEADPIVFRRDGTEKWGGIVLVGEADVPADTDTVIQHTIVEFARTGLLSRYDAPTVSNNLFASNDSAFQIVGPEGVAVTISGNQFENNGTGLSGYAVNVINVTQNDFWNNAANIVARWKPIYDCPGPGAAWEIHQNDILRGPQNSDFWSFDVQALAPFEVDATDNWWGTTSEEKIAGRVNTQDGRGAERIDWQPISGAANTAWTPPGDVPSPAVTPSIATDPAFTVTFNNLPDGECVTDLKRLSGTAGTALAPPDALKKVRIALQRKLPDGRCSWWSRRQRTFLIGYCAIPRWFRPTGLRKWSYDFPAPLATGRYEAFASAQGDGPTATVTTHFRVLPSP
jgi:hypothetical protein